jgi:bisanhydrobacterioruberin hydratase
MPFDIKQKPFIGWLVLLIFHTVGLLGILSPYRDFFVALTPFNLLLTMAILFVYNEGDKRQWWSAFVWIFILGFLAEWIGVKTGFPFGDYSYGKNLGLRLDGIPVIIGVNWFILILATRAMSEVFISTFMKIVGGALLMVTIDFLIEPVAMKIDFWMWTSAQIPLQNYIGWFGLSLFFHWLSRSRIPVFKNPMAIPVFIAQVLFFFILNNQL